MVLYVVNSFRILEYFKNDSLRRRQRSCGVDALAFTAGMLFICVLIMSLMIVKVSSSSAATSFHQHKKPHSQKAHERSDCTVADSARTALAIEAAHQPPTPGSSEFSPPPLLPLKAPLHNTLKHNRIVREVQNDRQPHYHQQHHKEQQQQQQPQPQLKQLSHATSGKTAYSLERTGNNLPEQPIYGTWLTKAKRPQPPAVGAPEATTVEPTATIALAALSDDSDFIDSNPERLEHHDGHMLRRSATMTPTQSEWRDQLPRPPRIVSRQPSMWRRQLVAADAQYNEIDREYSQPKPFHFPQEGALPHEFTKFQPLPEPERSTELNNIQDILRQLQLGGMQAKASPQPPQPPPPPPPAPPQHLIMMPTGLHVAGSFKNFKSSGIANFFRNKRYKKHLQLAVPLHWMGGYQPPLIPAYAPHQRIAMDQLYSFKPRSPNEINLLAMQQQHQLQLQSSSRSRNKKKRKQPVVTMMGSPSLFSMPPPHTNQRPFTADPFLQQSYHPHYMFALNQSQKSKPKRIPFKLNLDIYPVATPTKDYKASAFTLEEAKVPTTARPASAVQSPFGDYYPVPPAPAAASAFPYVAPADNLVYNAYNLPPFGGSKSPLTESPKSSSSVLNFNTNSNPFYGNPLQQQQQQQQQQQLPYSFAHQQSVNYYSSVDQMQPAVSASASGPAANPNPNSNQLLLHLNVFPKQPSSVSASSNPFYSNIASDSINNLPLHSINRQSTEDQPLPQPETAPQLPAPRLKPRCNKTANRTVPMNHASSVARSDNSELSAQGPIDFEHPIVAAEIPTAQSLVALRSNSSNADVNASNGPQLVDSTLELFSPQQEDHANFRYVNVSASNVDPQMIAEARTASLFRFPVEDLIKFQVDDAL